MKIKNPFQSATEKLFDQEVEKSFYLKAAESPEKMNSNGPIVIMIFLLIFICLLIGFGGL